MKGLIFAVSLALVAGLAVCGTLPAGRPSTRTPVGTCPPKDGVNPVYLPDSEDCNVFYECSAGEPQPKQCMAGLCFNPTLNVCDWSGSVFSVVGECPPRDTNDTVYLPDDSSCQLYYVCSNGRPIPLKCANGTVWNDEKKICDDPIDAGCDLEGFKHHVAARSALGQCPPTDPPTPVYLADSESCSLYYECSNGEAIQNHCAGELQWNVQLNTCTLPLDSGCKLGRRQARSAVGTCPPKDPANPVYLADSESCSLYYECSNGEAVQNHCADGLEWNQTLHTCTDPLDSQCKVGTTAAPPTTEN